MEFHILVRNGLAYRCKFNESIGLRFRVPTVEFGITKKKNAKMEYFVIKNGLAYRCKFNESISLRFKNVSKFSQCECSSAKTEKMK
jgi:hypothetical protein